MRSDNRVSVMKADCSGAMIRQTMIIAAIRAPWLNCPSITIQAPRITVAPPAIGVAAVEIVINARCAKAALRLALALALAVRAKRLRHASSMPMALR